jgi:hypothetical protein
MKIKNETYKKEATRSRGFPGPHDVSLVFGVPSQGIGVKK